MKKLSLSMAALALAAAPAFCQVDEAAPAASVYSEFIGTDGLGDPLTGTLDVQTGPNDLRCLGVMKAWGKFWVSGAGDGSGGVAQKIHRYDLNGNFESSFQQSTASSPLWGGRDFAVNEAGNVFWLGSEAGEINEYSHSGGNISWVRRYSYPALGIVRALGRNPNTGRFYCADFRSVIREFDITNGTVVNTFSNLNNLAFYGFSWDAVNNTIWGWSQDGTPLVRATEFDPASFVPTGREFQGFDPGFVTNIAGGCHIYCDDPRNPGRVAMVGLHQGDFDFITVYDMDAACGGGGFAITLSGPCPGSKTLSWTGAGSGQMGIVIGNAQGNTTIPFGPCQGTVLGIRGSLLLYNVIGTQGGAGQVSGTVGGNACGKFVQCINTGTCNTSNVAGPI